MAQRTFIKLMKDTLRSLCRPSYPFEALESWRLLRSKQRWPRLVSSGFPESTVSLPQRQAKTKVTFLEVEPVASICLCSKCLSGSVSAADTALAGFISQDTLKGLPVKKDVSIKTIDPYFAAYIRDATCPDTMSYLR